MEHEHIEALTERFSQSLSIVIQNLGPQLIRRTQSVLTPGQAFLLYLARQEGTCPISRLAEKMEVAKSSITLMLDRLENHGFVIRERDEKDRRVVTVQLTDAGEAVLNHVVDIRLDILQRCLAQFHPDELNALVSSLEKLAPITANIDIDDVIAQGK